MLVPMARLSPDVDLDPDICATRLAVAFHIAFGDINVDRDAETDILKVACVRTDGNAKDSDLDADVQRGIHVAFALIAENLVSEIGLLNYQKTCTYVDRLPVPVNGLPLAQCFGESRDTVLTLKLIDFIFALRLLSHGEDHT
jgi:hypothetical protein